MRFFSIFVRFFIFAGGLELEINVGLAPRPNVLMKISTFTVNRRQCEVGWGSSNV